MKKRYKVVNSRKVGVFLGVILVVVAVIAAQLWNTREINYQWTYSDFQVFAEEGLISQIRMSGSSRQIDAWFTSGGQFTFWSPLNDEFVQFITEHNIPVITRGVSPLDAWLRIASTLPLVLFMLLLGFMMVYIVSSYTLSTGGTTLDKRPDIRFKDVGGLTEVKEDISWIVDLLNGSVIKGVRMPRGVLFYGPPGTGKTLLAKAIAGEANVPFIALSGSDFLSMWAGRGSMQVKRLYSVASENAPCVIFIDEIDSIAAKRSTSETGVSRDTNATLNALLNAMDGITGKNRVVFVAATNMVSQLDEAILRAGRFDKQIYVGPPKTLSDTREIVDLHLEGKQLNAGTDRDLLYQMFRMRTGAEIENVLNNAVLESIRKGDSGVLKFDYVQRSLARSIFSSVETVHATEEAKYRAAVHEAGHALIGMECGRRLLYVTVIPQNIGVGGLTVFEYPEDSSMQTLQDLIDAMACALAGGIAEEIVLGYSSTLSIKDLETCFDIEKVAIAADFLEKDSDCRKEIRVQVMRILQSKEEQLKEIAQQLIERTSLFGKDLDRHGGECDRYCGHAGQRHEDFDG